MTKIEKVDVDSIYEFDDNTRVTKVISALKLIVDDPELGKFEITGFKNSNELEDFILFGDFINSKDNSFFLCTKSKTKLQWSWLKI